MPTLPIPGFVDAHCHAFQRALRGRTGGGDFWGWRDEMLALAERLTVAEIRREYVEVYRELRENGYTAVGEFHYLGLARGPRRRRSSRGGRDRVRLPVRVLPARRHPALPAGLGRRVPDRARGAPHRRDRGRSRPPLRPGVPCGGAAGAWPVRGRARPAASRPRRRAAARDRGVSGRAWPAADRAARTRGLPRPADVDHPRDPRERPRARPAPRRGRRDLRLPDHRGEPRRRLPAGRARPAPRDRPLDRLRLERAHRPARGAPRARGNRTTPDRDSAA